VRTALYNWLFARQQGGVFVLRIEDTDVARSDEARLADILEGLEWLGLTWDEGPYLQSERTQIYQEWTQNLINAGQAYYCFCTTEELEERRKQALSRGEAPRYDGRCVALTAAQQDELRDHGRQASVRFRIPDGNEVVVRDIIRGETVFDQKTLGDFVLLRSNGTPSFHLANVVDDILMKISHVVRGEDLYPSTPRHQLLYEAFGVRVPEFAHLPMILAPDRTKLSKRHGAVALAEYRQAGYVPEALVNYLSLLGWSPSDENELMSIDMLIQKFSLDRVGKSGAIFDIQKLNFMNGHKLRTFPLEQVAELAKPFFPPETLPQESQFQEAIALTRDSVTTLAEFPQACKEILGKPTYSGEIVAELAREPQNAERLRVLKEEIGTLQNMERDALVVVFKRAGKALGVKGKPLYHPLRLALTGKNQGPELLGIMSLLGKEECIVRIDTCLEHLRQSTAKRTSAE
jgi:glutamyl-tRNA synthetase